MFSGNLARAGLRAARPVGRRLLTTEADHAGSKYLAEEAAEREHARGETPLQCEPTLSEAPSLRLDGPLAQD